MTLKASYKNLTPKSVYQTEIKIIKRSKEETDKLTLERNRLTIEHLKRKNQDRYKCWESNNIDKPCIHKLRAKGFYYCQTQEYCNYKHRIRRHGKYNEEKPKWKGIK